MKRMRAHEWVAMQPRPQPRTRKPRAKKVVDKNTVAKWVGRVLIGVPLGVIIVWLLKWMAIWTIVIGALIVWG